MEKSRKRLYRNIIKCSKCGKEIDSDYKKEHIRRAHDGDQNIKFVPVVTDTKQRKLSFCLGASTSIQQTSLTCRNTEENAVFKQVQSTDEKNIIDHGTTLNLEQQAEECDARDTLKPDSGEEPAKSPENHAEHNKTSVSSVSQEAVNEDLSFSETSASHPKSSSSSQVQLLDGPNQPLLSEYNRKQFAKEQGTRDFNPALFRKYPWTSFNQSVKTIGCYPCQKYGNVDSFSFWNWKKPERLAKHSQSKTHNLAMTMDYRQN